VTDPIEYAFGGALIRSALPLPDLSSPRDSDRRTPIIQVVRSDRPLEGERVYAWPRHAGVFLERSHDGWVYRMPAQRLAVGIDPAGETVRVDSVPEQVDMAGEFLVRSVLPRVMDLHGRVLIHGATVAVADGTGPEDAAIALIGRSRAGKSTLAAALCRAGAFRMMGDDTAMLDRGDAGWQVHCSSRLGSLRPDSAAVFSDGCTRPALLSSEDKVNRRAPGEPVYGTRRLCTIYVLDTGEDIRIEPLSKYDAVWHAVQNSVRFNPGDWRAEADRLARIHALVQDVPAARLVYPRLYERLDEVCDLLRRQHL